MSTPTTQAAGTPDASAAANTVVASSATTVSSPASTPVVTSTVTTPSSPKRTMSLGEYKKARGNTLFARDELETLFDVGSDVDMADGEEDEEISSSRRDDLSVGSRHPREDDSDASSSKRSRSGSDRPLADAGPLSSPRNGGGPLRPPRRDARPPPDPTESVCTIDYVNGVPSHTRDIEVASPPRDATSITSLPGLSWKRKPLKS
ncbi:unnamed protein product [Phytophthora fragariaefolia]|uniref:Unnamed protein product n=1 Tax=Phytophthora fragariaefolia TaxID=1490495 RepID=A0A9W6X9S1_9STRA|nr:unnamed protein product [Phytophthora fragariaefolia]